MQNTFRQRAETCFRLAIDAGDPEISQLLIAIAGEWLAEAAQAELGNLECASIKQHRHPAMASQWLIATQPPCGPLSETGES
jgi:hypothetical protein